jgi:hypothetical protein
MDESGHYYVKRDNPNSERKKIMFSLLGGL